MDKIFMRSFENVQAGLEKTGDSLANLSEVCIKCEEYHLYILNHIQNVQYSAERLFKIIDTAEFREKYRKAAEIIGDTCYGAEDPYSMTPKLQDCPDSWLDSLVADHDVSKFSREEFNAYRKKFYPTGLESKQYDENNKNTVAVDEAFDQAWKHHYCSNDHHPKYWRIKNVNNISLQKRLDSELGDPVQMDIMAIFHMICDWNAMTIALKKNGELGWYPDETRDWWNYHAKDEHDDMHPCSVQIVNFLMNEFCTINLKQ